jgi:nucleoside-diphosphate-sugar epimerase
MGRRILVVGGTGLIGGAAALHLAEEGHEVVIAARHRPVAPALARLPFVPGSFLDGEMEDAVLQGFDALVFAAANDGRQLPRGADQEAYFHRVSTIGVPAFFARARASGIRRAVYVGSYYPDVLPAAMIDANAYLRSRRATEAAVRALAAEDFAVCSLNAPHVIGHIEGMRVPVIERVLRYLGGDIGGDEPRFAPTGGSNYMSTLSFAEAIAGAIERGESGRGYLMGDENWSFAAYFDAIRKAMGLGEEIAGRDAPHPIIPDGSLMALRGVTISYEPSSETVERLRYRRHDVARAIEAMTRYYLAASRSDGPERGPPDIGAPVSQVRVGGGA